LKVGYIRVSTLEQNEARQEVIMEHLGVEKVFMDKCSGKNMDRPELKKMLDFVREGDTLVVESISRLSRSVQDFLFITEQLREKKVNFISQKENFDFSTPTGQMMMQIFAVLAEFERKQMKERQLEGIKIAREQGKYKGRKPKELPNFEKLCEDYIEGKKSASSICRRLGISRSTFYARFNTLQRNQDGTGDDECGNE